MQPQNTQSWNNYFQKNLLEGKDNWFNERLNNFSNQTQNKIQEVSEGQDWNGEWFYVEVNQISIPIPSFVSLATQNKLKQTIQEVQQQVDYHLKSPSFRQQILDYMHKDFMNKNCQLFKKINSVDSNPSLKIQFENQNKLFQQNLNANTQKADDFRKFVHHIFNRNIKNRNLIENDIQQYMKNKESKKKPNNNKNYLHSNEDFMNDQKFIEETLNSIHKFGVDRCNIQKNDNQKIMSETISINFQERKTLKTITYSILHHNLCKQDKKWAKEYIYKVLSHINPNTKDFEQRNYILRQIYLLFLQTIIINSNNSNQTDQFLESVFKSEFLSSLLSDHLLFSAQQILKIKNHTNQNQDINTLLDQLSKANDFNLYLISQKEVDSKKYLHAKHKSREIFIYFEQCLQQDENQQVYYVVNPSDSFVCFAESSF
ncbi:hypothetical protein TTHERM_00391460 (macronuclear) [Tetrahymena thermophila SB210]|uniref:Uncharacterized protein n=1 Tax=Tetrahymena thermophila (strain SB210) TaxID=312017 RepID=Q233K4_TETTS|nr:hypothetical protein TTHERM_00391460 [Tetrahymena thermophila SB210]EAR91576.2 hypothetical protein TTHERM_00391460 [Tetrahymena thermophila SB210]|eukprot:XP_001011821.2 hypothetical protein TTHERM_00391460 [Tetrahymena thermophila SB210]